MTSIVTLNSAPFRVTDRDLSDSVMRSQALGKAWDTRREIQWTSAVRAGAEATQPAHQARAEITIVTQTQEKGVTTASAQIEIQVGDDDPDQALSSAFWFLDMHSATVPLPINPPGQGFLDRSPVGRGNEQDREFIGAVPQDFVPGRHLSDFSTYLGSYGQGGIGWLGFKLNEGSWMVMPLAHAAGWTWLTTETLSVDKMRTKLVFDIDRRVINCMPDQLKDFHPWHHRYAGPGPTIEDLPDFKAVRARVTRFEPAATSFTLEAEAGDTTYRFEIADHLPRPPHGGSKKDRLFHEGDNLGSALFMAHSPYVRC